MTRPVGLSQWHQTVSTYLPHLSTPPVVVLVMWSVGIVLAQRCGLSTVATILADLLGGAEASVRAHLRDWYRDAADKRGAKRGDKRRQVEVSTCFAPLLRWVVAGWDPTCPHIALAMDASTLGQRCTLLTISVVVRGGAIPVAWYIVEAQRAGAWRPHWAARFGHLDGAIPPDWTVSVLADRGRYAKWVCTTIQARGWHPYLRSKRQGQDCAAGRTTFRPLSQVVTRLGQTWAGRVTCFKTTARQLDCTLLARWDQGYRDPWLIVTDLPPTQADVAWYGLRAWIECGFKDSKRGGWHWEQTKMRDPRRAERLWLALAVATLWTVSVGCQAEVSMPGSILPAVPERHIARQRGQGRQRARTLRCFRRGRLVIVAALCSGQAIPQARLLPEPWPKSLDTHAKHLCGHEPLRKAA